jgi:hypothetical protein
MRYALSIFLLCASCSAAVCFDRNVPREAKESARRAAMQFESAGATLPRIRIKWDRTNKYCPWGFYAITYQRGKCFIVAINANDKKPPRWEVSLDHILMHEFYHALFGPEHQPADSVCENPLYDHLTQGDLARIGGSK